MSETRVLKLFYVKQEGKRCTLWVCVRGYADDGIDTSRRCTFAQCRRATEHEGVQFMDNVNVNQSCVE